MLAWILKKNCELVSSAFACSSPLHLNTLGCLFPRVIFCSNIYNGGILLSALQHPLRLKSAPLRVCYAPKHWLTHLLSTHIAFSSLELCLCLKMFSVLHLYCETLYLSFQTLSIFIILISSYHLPHSYQLGSYLSSNTLYYFGHFLII